MRCRLTSRSSGYRVYRPHLIEVSIDAVVVHISMQRRPSIPLCRKKSSTWFFVFPYNQYTKSRINKSICEECKHIFPQAENARRYLLWSRYGL